MCGRAKLTVSAEDLQQTFGALPPVGYRPRYNIAPTQDQLALIQTSQGTQFKLIRWGLVPFWADDLKLGNKMVLARAETVATTAAFRHAFAQRRCLVVIDGFYEWQRVTGGKRPHLIHRTSGEPFTLAGVWERWGPPESSLETCAIITAPATDAMQPIHDRMPVIVAEEDRAAWLGRETPEEVLKELLRPSPVPDLEAYEVSRFVNDPANDTEECIAPIGEVPDPLSPWPEEQASLFS